MANNHQNVTIALGLKAVFLVTTILGLTGPWIAIMADTGVTVLVTLNALRMLRFDPERRLSLVGVHPLGDHQMVRLMVHPQGQHTDEAKAVDFVCIGSGP